MQTNEIKPHDVIIGNPTIASWQRFVGRVRCIEPEPNALEAATARGEMNVVGRNALPAEDGERNGRQVQIVAWSALGRISRR